VKKSQKQCIFLYIV